MSIPLLSLESGLSGRPSGKSDGQSVFVPANHGQKGGYARWNWFDEYDFHKTPLPFDPYQPMWNRAPAPTFNLFVKNSQSPIMSHSQPSAGPVKFTVPSVATSAPDKRALAKVAAAAPSPLKYS